MAGYKNRRESEAAMLFQLLSMFLSIASASDCTTGTASQGTHSGTSCRVQKDALTKHNPPSRSSRPKKTDVNQGTVSK